MREVSKNTKRYVEKKVFPSQFRKKQSFNFDPKGRVHSHTCCLSLKSPLSYENNCGNHSHEQKKGQIVGNLLLFLHLHFQILGS